MCRIIYHIQNYEKKIHNAKKNRYKCYVVFFSKNLHTFLDGFIFNELFYHLTHMLSTSFFSVGYKQLHQMEEYFTVM